MEDPLDSPYHYTPTRWVAIIFLVLFGLSTVLHGVQACYFRTWWLLPTAFLCGILEIVGWSGRLWSSFTPTKFPPFAMQLAFLVIGPTPLLSVNFITFEKLVKRLGPAYSRLQPKYYAIIFMSCDVLALVLQVMGGVLVSTAYTDNQADNGTIVMLAGIGFQLVVIVGFIVLSVEYFVRYFTDVPFKLGRAPPREATGEPQIGSEKRLNVTPRGRLSLRGRVVIYGLAFSTLCLFIRSIYRTIELKDGWDGPIIDNEVLLNVLDGAMVILAIYTVNIVHPGLFLPYILQGERLQSYIDAQ